MKSQSRLIVTLLAVTAGLMGMAVVLTSNHWATAQPADTAQDLTKAPDNQKKSEKPATNPDRPKVEGKISSQAKAREYREKLDQPVTIEFEQGTPLREALNHISERYGLTILIDVEAFKTDNNEPDIENKPIKLPRLNGIRLRTVLRAIFQQIQVDFYRPGDLLIVVPRKRIEAGAILRQPVDVAFEKRPLAEALRELSDMTGVSIILDAQKQQDPTIQLTADFENVPMEAAARVLADMAGLKSIAMENMIYITAPGNADNLELEAARKRGQAPAKWDEEMPKKNK